MSLFPAYKKKLTKCEQNECASSNITNEKNTTEKGQWLENRSFNLQPICSTNLQKPFLDVSESLGKELNEITKRSRTKRKRKKEIGKNRKETNTKNKDDTKNLDKRKCLQKKKKKNRKPKISSSEGHTVEEINDQSEISFSESSKKLSDVEILEKSRNFRAQLRDRPDSVNLWIDYINFQDDAISNSTSLVQEKLEIINNALSANKSNDRLLRLKYDFVKENLPFDEANEELKRDLMADENNLFLRRQQISLFLYSLTHFNANTVLKMYIETLRSTNAAIAMEETLSVHLELYTFIRQTGLWELLCKMIILNLQIHFNGDDDINSFNFQPLIEQNVTTECEEVILTSGLPPNQLWSRLEILRSRVYWYPTEDASCTDPQRIVLTSDVSDCLYPIVNPDDRFDLAVYSLISLKVPMLPFRHYCSVALSLNKAPWYLDSSEFMLVGYFDNGILPSTSCIEECTLPKQMQQLLTNPQYLTYTIGTDEFKNFITNTFQDVIKSISNVHLNAMLLWWTRFERWLLSFRSDLSGRKETLNRVISKAENYRDNVFLYVEYALLVKDLKGNLESCISILNKVLKHKQIDAVSIFRYNNDNEEKVSLTFLYNIYTRLLLTADRRKECLQRLIYLAVGRNKDVDDHEVIEEALSTYEQVIIDCLTAQDLSKRMRLWEIMQPQFLTECVACWATMLYITRSASSAVQKLKSLTNRLPSSDSEDVTLASYYREIIYEININILEYDYYKRDRSNSSELFFELLNDAVRMFPNNAYFLKTFATLEVQLWHKWDNITDNSDLLKTDSSLLAVVLCLISITKVCEYKKQITTVADSIILDHDLFSPTRIRSIISKFTKNLVGEHCPLIWSIFLQCTNMFETTDKYKDLFYVALEKCPWSKLLYQEASGVLDDQLHTIQDMLIEKEIRIHVSPEELTELMP